MRNPSRHPTMPADDEPPIIPPVTLEVDDTVVHVSPDAPTPPSGA